jgi:hypothetical protein
MEFSERLKHLRAISGLWWFGVSALWTLLSIADVLVTHYGTDRFRTAWNAAWYLPRWGWRAWMIGFLVITVISIAEGSYRNAALRKEMTPNLVVPEVYLEYRDAADMFEYSRLFVRVQNDRNAFAVRLSSPIVIGEKDRRMGLLWDVPLGMIGQSAVPVAARCVVYRENDEEIADPIGGLKGEQIEEFLLRKADKPDEVIVNVDYLDVQGRHYPPKQFRLFLHRNEAEALRTVRCVPVPIGNRRS